MAITHADARGELVEQLDLHVRDLVRRQGESIFERSGGELRRTNAMAPRAELYERVGIDIHGLLNEPMTGSR